MLPGDLESAATGQDPLGPRSRLDSFFLFPFCLLCLPWVQHSMGPHRPSWILKLGLHWVAVHPGWGIRAASRTGA